MRGILTRDMKLRVRTASGPIWIPYHLHSISLALLISITFTYILKRSGLRIICEYRK